MIQNGFLGVPLGSASAAIGRVPALLLSTSPSAGRNAPGWNDGNAAARLDLQAGWDTQMAVYFLEKCLEFRGLVSNPLLDKHGTAVPGAQQGQACCVPPAQGRAVQGISEEGALK